MKHIYHKRREDYLLVGFICTIRVTDLSLQVASFILDEILRNINIVRARQ